MSCFEEKTLVVDADVAATDETADAIGAIDSDAVATSSGDNGVCGEERGVESPELSWAEVEVDAGNGDEDEEEDK